MSEMLSVQPGDIISLTRTIFYGNTEPTEEIGFVVSLRVRRWDKYNCPVDPEAEIVLRPIANPPSDRLKTYLEANFTEKNGQILLPADTDYCLSPGNSVVGRCHLEIISSLPVELPLSELSRPY